MDEPVPDEPAPDVYGNGQIAVLGTSVPGPFDLAKERHPSRYSAYTVKTRGVFSCATKEKGDATRQQMIEYVSLAMWSGRSCRAALLAVLLWTTMFLMVSSRSHTLESFKMHTVLSGYLSNLTADTARGVAPEQVMVDGDDKSVCRCSCALEVGELCDPSATVDFDGAATPAQLQLLRARAAYYTQAASSSASASLRWDDVRTIPEVWFWLQHGLLPALWHERGRDDPVDMGSLFSATAGGSAPAPDPAGGTGQGEPGFVLPWTEIIGGVRLRQRRLATMDCSVSSRITDRYGSVCHSDTHTVRPYGPGSDSNIEGFIPDASDSTAYDVYLDVRRPFYHALETIEFILKRHDWLDAATDSLEVQAAYLNAESTPPLFGTITVTFRFERSGGLQRSIELRTAAAVIWPSWFNVVVDLVWLFLVLCLYGRQLTKGLRRMMRKLSQNEWNRHDTADEEPRLCDLWDMMDWITIIASIILLSIFLLLARDTGDISDAVGSLAKEAPPAGSTAQQLQEYHDEWGKVLNSSMFLVEWTRWMHMLYFWYTMLVSLQFFRVLRGQLKLAMLVRVVSHAAEDLVHFLIIFLVIFLNFAFSGYMVYGLVLEGWSTPAKAINSSFRSLLGSTDLIEMYDAAPISTVVWFGLFMSTIIFVMLNLLLAIMFDHYSIVKGKAAATTGIFTQMSVFLLDEKARAGGWCQLFRSCLCALCCCACCGRCRRSDHMPHRELLSELMKRAGYPLNARRAVHSSVLGPKWRRREVEESVFIGADLDEDRKAALAHMPVEKDLVEMGVDQDYAAELIDRSLLHSQREYNKEEAQTAQLRELVTIAEAEIVEIRCRLETCGRYMKKSMRGLSRRMESLEHLVHSSLAELVQIAEIAGVPDKVEARSMANKARLDSTITSLRSLDPATKTEGLLTGSIDRVLHHLNKGQEAGEAPSTTDWHRAVKQVDTRGTRLDKSQPMTFNKSQKFTRSGTVRINRQ